MTGRVMRPSFPRSHSQATWLWQGHCQQLRRTADEAHTLGIGLRGWSGAATRK